MQKQKGLHTQAGISTLVGVTIIVAVAVVLFGGVFAYQYFAKSQTPITLPSQTCNDQQNPNVQTQQQTENQVSQNSKIINGFTSFDQILTSEQLKSGCAINGEQVKFVWIGCSASDNDIVITLKSAFNENLMPKIIAENIKNIGQFTWTVPQNLTGVYFVTISSASCNSSFKNNTNIEIQNSR